jgi:hypothetical protein
MLIKPLEMAFGHLTRSTGAVSEEAVLRWRTWLIRSACRT